MNNTVKLHLVALPHTQVSKEFITCAYTQKVLKFCKMMKDEYEILLYAPEGPLVEGAQLIQCLSTEERLKIFGPDNLKQCPGWPKDTDFELFNKNATTAIRSNLAPQDIILLVGGYSHHGIQDELKHGLTCEPGVGYLGIFANFCAFESYAWMHHVYAKKNIGDGRFFDCVIPNYFDLDDFQGLRLNETPSNYLLFVGRLVARKGPHIAAMIADACDLELRVAGPGMILHDEHTIVSPEIVVRGKRLTYAGVANPEERMELMRHAYALIMPTTYIEPFGGVAVEAMLCGCPVVSTDFGAFTETVVDGLTGFRFHTLREARDAVNQCPTIDRARCREIARQQYSLEAVRPQFIRWFDQLGKLQSGKGWYEL
jgi:glycosyltransferase involved in cell wall biosynthesis